MRKILFISVIIIIAVAVVLLFGHKVYSPLSKQEYEQMFSKIGEIKLLYGEDAVHWDLHGDAVEYYVYQTTNSEINLDFPLNIKEWDCQLINKKCQILSWSQISKDTLQISTLWKIGEQSFKDGKFKDDFSSALADTNNYLSLILLDELQHYLFIFDPFDERLYYYRVNL